MKHNKKAFTVVELVIVIAILAILAAVLIPTFVGLVEKANESNTLKLVKNLNTALKVDMPDGKHPTMQSALDAAKGFGYDVEKINANKSATGDNEILWDSVNDCFVYVKGVEKEYAPETLKVKDVKDYQYWTISNTVSDTYSTYLFGFTGTEITGLKTGVDVGETTGITKIAYVGSGAAQEVTIRTNGGNLTVDAADDTVYHYGSSERVDVIRCAMASFHEYGNVMLIQLSQGRVVAENGSVISQISISEGVDVSAIKVAIEADAEVAIVTATTDISGVVDSKNDDTAVVNKADEANKYVAYIGKQGYTNLKSAIKNAKSGQKVTLVKYPSNMEYIYWSVSPSDLAGKELTIDLNGFTMEFDGINLDVNTTTRKTVEKLTFIDSGATKGKMIGRAGAANSFAIGPGDTVVLDGINMESKATGGFYPRGNGATLEIKNSTILAKTFGISTNASGAENYGVSVLIENSILETKSEDQDNVAVLINVDSSLIIKNSTLKGQRQAMVLRGGTAVIEDSTLEKTGTKASSEYTDYSDETLSWGDGNKLPAYALVLGNRPSDNSSCYQYATNVTLKNVTIKGGIYSWGNSATGLGTTITFVGTNQGTFVKNGNVKVTGDIPAN